MKKREKKMSPAFAEAIDAVSKMRPHQGNIMVDIKNHAVDVNQYTSQAVVALANAATQNARALADIAGVLRTQSNIVIAPKDEGVNTDGKSRHV